MVPQYDSDFLETFLKLFQSPVLVWVHANIPKQVEAIPLPTAAENILIDGFVVLFVRAKLRSKLLGNSPVTEMGVSYEVVFTHPLTSHLSAFSCSSNWAASLSFLLRYSYTASSSTSLRLTSSLVRISFRSSFFLTCSR